VAQSDKKIKEAADMGVEKIFSFITAKIKKGHPKV
jgi:hypothetical protein